MQEVDRNQVAEKMQRILTGRLNQLCREQHISLKELSRKSGVSIATVRKISQGKYCNVGIAVVIKFSRVFGVTPSQFVDENLLQAEDKFLEGRN